MLVGSRPTVFVVNRRFLPASVRPRFHSHPIENPKDGRSLQSRAPPEFSSPRALPSVKSPKSFSSTADRGRVPCMPPYMVAIVTTTMYGLVRTDGNDAFHFIAFATSVYGFEITYRHDILTASFTTMILSFKKLHNES